MNSVTHHEHLQVSTSSRCCGSMKPVQGKRRSQHGAYVALSVELLVAFSSIAFCFYGYTLSSNPINLVLLGNALAVLVVAIIALFGVHLQNTTVLLPYLITTAVSIVMSMVMFTFLTLDRFSESVDRSEGAALLYRVDAAVVALHVIRVICAVLVFRCFRAFQDMRAQTAITIEFASDDEELLHEAGRKRKMLPKIDSVDVDELRSQLETVAASRGDVEIIRE